MNVSRKRRRIGPESTKNGSHGGPAIRFATRTVPAVHDQTGTVSRREPLGCQLEIGKGVLKAGPARRQLHDSTVGLGEIDLRRHPNEGVHDRAVVRPLDDETVA